MGCLEFLQYFLTHNYFSNIFKAVGSVMLVYEWLRNDLSSNTPSLVVVKTYVLVTVLGLWSWTTQQWVVKKKLCWSDIRCLIIIGRQGLTWIAWSILFNNLLGYPSLLCLWLPTVIFVSGVIQIFMVYELKLRCQIFYIFYIWCSGCDSWDIMAENTGK